MILFSRDSSAQRDILLSLTSSSYPQILAVSSHLIHGRERLDGMSHER